MILDVVELPLDLDATASPRQVFEPPHLQTETTQSKRVERASQAMQRHLGLGRRSPDEMLAQAPQRRGKLIGKVS